MDIFSRLWLKVLYFLKDILVLTDDFQQKMFTFKENGVTSIRKRTHAVYLSSNDKVYSMLQK